MNNFREIGMKNKRKKANIIGLSYRDGHSFTTTTACCLVSQSLSITHNFMSMRPIPSLGMLKRPLNLFNVSMLIFLKIIFFQFQPTLPFSLWFFTNYIVDLYLHLKQKYLRRVGWKNTHFTTCWLL